MIRTANISKYYGGKRALGPVSFEIEDGETVGFLGLNGAGKTTALRILACDLRPSGGTVSVNGVDALADPHAVRQRIGFLPESPPLYQDMTVSDYLFFAGQLRGMSKAEVKKRLPEVLELTDLTDVEHETIGHLSHGYRQRVGVAQAIIHNPSLLILDEPTRGLDPVQIVEMRNMIYGLKENHTVLISSHILTEISQTCDRLLVLGQGEIIAKGTERELTTGMADVKTITAIVRADDKVSSPYRGEQVKADSDDADDSAGTGDGDEAKAENGADKDGDGDDAGQSDPVLGCIEAVNGVESVKADKLPYEDAHVYRISCASDIRADISRAIVKAGHDLLKLDHGHSELERTFLKLVKGGGDANN